MNGSSSSSTSTNLEETTVTVTTPTRLITQTSNGYKGTAHITPVGTKFTVDRLEFNELSKRSENDDHFYHIKGTNQWINASDVKAAKVFHYMTISLKTSHTLHSLKILMCIMQTELPKIITVKK